MVDEALAILAKAEAGSSLGSIEPIIVPALLVERSTTGRLGLSSPEAV